jgi:sterol desaturase/sphingolipid hydroxylase (fatty acid hydroxylase superfamily)
MELINNILSIDPNYILIGLLSLFFFLEQVTVNPYSFKNRGSHLFQNLLFQISLTLLNLVFFSIQLQWIAWLNQHQIGLLHMTDWPYWLKLVLGVVLYDLSTYWIHRASHKVPLLWKLHRVHHSDTHMDSSTTFRFHPLEIILVYQTGNVITAALFGTDMTSLALYYVILYVFFFLEHSNLNYPKWLNQTLGLVLVMPDFHRVHHHKDQQFTDSNFADIFILWDRIFRTFKWIPVKKEDLGLEEFDAEKKQTFLYLMKSPFRSVSKDKSN